MQELVGFVVFKMDVEVIRLRIINEVSEQLCIVNIPARKELHDYLIGNYYKNILQSFNRIYENISLRKYKSRSKRLFDYFTECRVNNSILIQDILSDLINSNNELGKLISFETDAHAVLLYYAISALKCSEKTGEQQQSISVSEQPEVQLICLGGGTLGDIINLNKKRMKNEKLSKFQSSQARMQLQYAKHFCMSREDKAQLPDELKDRDRGGMYFPMECVMPFIRLVNASSVTYANKEAFRRHGRDLLKVIFMNMF